MSAFDVVSLADGAPVDLAGHLAGGWGPVQVLSLDAGATHTFTAEAVEVCAFLIEGRADVAMHGAAVDGHVEHLHAGMAFTLSRGTAATVSATAPTRLFAASLPA